MTRDPEIKVQVKADGANKATGDVERFDKSLERLTKNAGGKFADSFNNTGLGSFAGDLTKGAGALDVFSGSAGIAAGAVTAFAAAGVYAGKTLFDLAKNTAEYATEIDNFNKLTSFSVETIQGLKIAAEKTGGSLDEIEEVFESFVELMVEGGQGAEDATQKIKSLGLDPLKAHQDLEGSFLKVLDKIREMPTQASKAKIAMDGMGESGLNMVKVADAMTGGSQKYIDTLREQGLLMDAEGVRKSKEFSDALSELEKQASSAAREFSVGFMPAITMAMRSVSGEITGNKTVWQEWGGTVGNTIFKAIQNAKLLVALIADLSNQDFTFTRLKLQATANTIYADKFDSERLKSDNGRKASELGGVSDADLNKWATRPDGFIKKENKSSGKSAKNSVEQDMRKTFEELGFEVKRTFGKAINKGSLHPAGKAIDLRIHGKTTEELFKAAIVGINKGWQLVDERVPRVGKNGKPIKQTGPHFHFEKDSGNDPSLFLGAEYYGGQKQLDYLKKLDKARLEKRPGGEFLKEQEDSLQKNLDYITRYEKMLSSVGETTHRRNVEQSEEFQKLSEAQKEYVLSLADNLDASEKAAKAGEEFNSYVSSLNSSYESLIPTQTTATETLEGWLNKLKETGVVLSDEDEALLRRKAQTIDFNKKLEKELEWLEKINEAERRRREEKEKNKPEHLFKVMGAESPSSEGIKPKRSKADAFFGNDLEGGFFNAMGGERFQTDAEMMEATLQRLGEIGANSFNMMADALGSLVENWVLYGEMSGQNAKKALASALAMAAGQATVHAIMETAAGIAALTPWGAAYFGPAAFHFKSAAMFAAIAAGTAFAGRAVAGDSFKNDREGNNQKSPDYFTSNPNGLQTTNQNLTANRGVLRETDVKGLTSAIDEFNQKVSTMKPEEVFTTGMKKSPGAVGNQALRDIKTNSTLRNETGKALGLA